MCFLDISETRINTTGYSLMRTDHPSNTKCGGVYMHYKNYIPVTSRTDIKNV